MINALIVVGGVAIIGIAFMFRRELSESVEEGISIVTDSPQGKLRAIFEKYGAMRGIDPDLLAAFAIVESDMNPAATRVNAGSHDFSVGLMQVLCIPNDEGICTNKFNVQPWPVSFNALLDPDMNVNIASQILRWNLDAYGYPRGIAVYNHWGARNSPLNGPFPNQAYVNKVLSNLAMLKGA